MPLPKKMKFSTGVKNHLQTTSSAAKSRTDTSTRSAVARKSSSTSGLFRRKSSSSHSDSMPILRWKLPPIAGPLKFPGVDEPKKRHEIGPISWDPNIVESKKEESQLIVVARTSAALMDTHSASSPKEMELSAPSSPSKTIEAPNVLISTIEVHEKEQAPLPMDKRDESVMPSTQVAGTINATRPQRDDLNSLLAGCFSEETPMAARVADQARLVNNKRGMEQVEVKERC